MPAALGDGFQADAMTLPAFDLTAPGEEAIVSRARFPHLDRGRRHRSTSIGCGAWGARVTRTSVFQTNRSQAVRLPKDVAFPPNVTDVVILRDGPRRIIVPAESIWDDFFASPGVDMPEREQPPVTPAARGSSS